MLNKARLFDEGFAKNPVTVAKVISVLVDFNLKMEEILLKMRGLFERLKAQQLVPLNQLSNLFKNTKELPTLQGWKARAAGHMPTSTKSAQPQASKLAKEATKEEPACKQESQPGPDPTLEGSKSP